MADVVLVRCLFIFLLINTCYSGLPGPLEGDGSSSPSGAADNHIQEETILVNKMMVRQPRRRKFHKRYKCHQCEPPDCMPSPSTDCRDALYCFKATVRGADGGLQYSRGCSERFEHYQFTCWTGRSVLQKRHAGQVNITCCKGDMCNEGDFPDLPPVADTAIEPVPSNAWKLWASVAAAVLAVSVVGAVAVFLLRRTHKLRVSRAALHKLGSNSGYFPTNMYSQPVTNYYEDNSASQSGGLVVARCATDSTLRQFLEGSLSSGSGAGLPLMNRRTLARQVLLRSSVGKGRFGEVWRGLWYADEVAVKIFFSRDEASWRRETEIYSTVLLRHDNILAYIGSDMTSRNGCTQLWLITHYHPLGSLYEYLARCVPTLAQAAVLLLSAVNGVLHLHTEIHGTQGKPAIAHRDLKSKNILVKNNGECCIADFGLSVSSSNLTPPSNPRQGTKRYMSPELLDESMNLECFESYRKSDMYSLALVMWEVCWRAGDRPYRAPYQGCVPQDPSFDDMRKIVCVDAQRPPLHQTDQPTMTGIFQLIRECWHSNPEARLPALRVKKTLLKLCQQDNSIQLDQDNEVSV